VIATRAQGLADALPRGGRAGDLAQALMDLGATICTPKKPDCLICPLNAMCAARTEGDPERYPIKAEKRAVPTRYGSAFVLMRGHQILLVRRPPAGLLGGMMMPPTSAWTERKLDDPFEGAPGQFPWEHVGEIRHVFTHFALRLGVWRATASLLTKTAGKWMERDEALAALPTVGRKAVLLAVR
jgi:A/G-specific adenine glycosylase